MLSSQTARQTNVLAAWHRQRVGYLCHMPVSQRANPALRVASPDRLGQWLGGRFERVRRSPAGPTFVFKLFLKRHKSPIPELESFHFFSFCSRKPPCRIAGICSSLQTRSRALIHRQSAGIWFVALTLCPCRRSILAAGCFTSDLQAQMNPWFRPPIIRFCWIFPQKQIFLKGSVIRA